MVGKSFASALTASLAVAGCTSVESDNVLTSGIYASITATAEGNGQTRVVATLYLDGPETLNFIELGPDDELWAYGPEAQDERMRETQLFGATSYSAEFDGDVAGDEFIVEFTREVDDGAPESRASLPAQFEILTDGGFAASRSEDLIVEYTPEGDPDESYWELDGTCIESVSGDIVDDTGTITIAGGLVQKIDSDDVEDTCDATLTVRRVLEGDLDAGYGEGGRIVGRQERTLSFTTEP